MSQKPPVCDADELLIKLKATLQTKIDRCSDHMRMVQDPELRSMYRATVEAYNDVLTWIVVHQQAESLPTPIAFTRQANPNEPLIVL